MTFHPFRAKSPNTQQRIIFHMAKGFEIEGSVKVLNDLQTFPSGFTKREFVVEVQDGNYPQMIKFETVKERTSLLDGLNLGDPVKVFFDIRGNEYQGRYYVNLNAWKIEKNGAGGGGMPAGGPPPQEFGGGPAQGQPDFGNGGGGNPADLSDTGDDIPF